MYRISFNQPNLPEGGEIQITGLPFTFQNGKSYDISDEMAHQYRLSNPVVSDTPEGHVAYDLGPTLEEAFANNEHVKVTQEGGND